MTDSLENYLKGQRDAGSVTGEGYKFTLNPEKAWQKLGAYQLSIPEAWVLKLVQASVVDRAREIKVTQSRERTTIRVVGVSWTLNPLWDAVFKPATGSAIDDLAVAVRTLISQANRHFELEFPDGMNIAWNGKSFADQKSVEPSGDFQLSVDHKPIDGDQSWFGLGGNAACARYAAALAGQLEENCLYCPVPIKLDGRRLGAFFADFQVYLPLKVSEEAVSGIRLDAQPTFKTLKGHRRDKRKHGWSSPRPFFSIQFSGFRPRGEFPGAGIFLDAKVESGRVFGGFKTDRLQPRPARFEWVRDGAVVEREEWTQLGSVFGLKIVADAGSLGTDLSGLSLIDSPEKASLRKAILTNSAIVLGEMKASFEKDFVPTDGRILPSSFSNGFVKFVIYFLVAVVCVVGLPVVLLILVANSLGNADEKRLSKALDEQAQAFEEDGMKRILSFLKSQITA